jgi:hypothetical protein
MTKKRQKPPHLDMSFDEALKRFAKTDPREIPAPKPKKAKRKRSSVTVERADHGAEPTSTIK